MWYLRRDHKSKSSRKVAFASFVGTAIEWYDFYLYGTAAALIFNKLFFPQFNPIAGVMAAYATYAVGFFARPLGGVIFGHFGDKISRKNMLIVTLSTMGIATFLIGLLPTYQQIGIFAPILLVLLRCIQGIGVGGEWGGAVTMAAEHSRKEERGFYSSWPNAGAPFGLTLSIIVFLIFSSLPEKQFITWGWRVPFIIGITLVLVGLFIRLRIMESPMFKKIVKVRRPKVPALEVIVDTYESLLLVMGSRFVESASFYILTVFVLSYSTDVLNLPKNLLLYAVLLGAIGETITIPLFGHLSDRIGRRPVYMGGAILMGLFAFPFFWLLQTKSSPYIIAGIVFGMCIAHAAMHGAQAAFFAERFKTRIRYSGVAIAYHLSAAFSGGLAPLIATGLVAWANGKSWPVSVYLIIMALITIVSVFLTAERAQTDISK